MNSFQYQVIANTIDYLAATQGRSDNLEMMAARAGYDKIHFQKMFKQFVGISPKRLCQYIQMNRFKPLLSKGVSREQIANDYGLSSSSRIYDLCVSAHGITPSDFSYKGKGLKVRYGFFCTALGEILLAKTDKGICYLGFLIDQERDQPVARMKSFLGNASFEQVEEEFDEIALINKVFETGLGKSETINLSLHGTNFQLQVWQALLNIPFGKTLSYKDIAVAIGRPSSSRAVGNAVGANPVSFLVPCHRVIRSSGIIDNYGWGNARKKIILGMETEKLLA
jgi:AraC family transcriptional regulator of adaptative response/methylated-DNA-[protein]-cysteine methyltransferase